MCTIGNGWSVSAWTHHIRHQQQNLYVEYNMAGHHTGPDHFGDGTAAASAVAALLALGRDATSYN